MHRLQFYFEMSFGPIAGLNLELFAQNEALLKIRYYGTDILLMLPQLYLSHSIRSPGVRLS